MTQEEIQQKAYEVYPLDLDRHMIIEGEPYDNNKEKREAYIRGLTDSKPSLPSNLDEAEFEYAQSLDEIPANQEEEKMINDAFKAGAQWRDAQIQKLPNNLDEVAEEYIKFKPRYDIQQELEEGEDPTEIECFTIDAAIDSFKAGAEWLAGQGEKTMATVGYYNHCGLSILIEPSLEKQGFKEGDKLKVILSKQ